MTSPSSPDAIPRRPGSDLIEAVVENMRRNLEPLKYSVLAPSRYVVYLHPDEFARFIRAELEKWARKRGKKIAIVPALETLKEKRESLLGKFVESADQFEQLIRSEPIKPVIERIHAVTAPVRGRSGVMA